MLRNVYEIAAKHVLKQRLLKNAFSSDSQKNNFRALNCHFRTVHSEREVGTFQNSTSYDIPNEVNDISKEAETDENENEHISRTEETGVTSDPIALRAYQKECISSIVSTLSSGEEKKIAVSIATGGGKTVIFSMHGNT